MKTHSILAATACLALAACGGGDTSSGNAAAAAGASQGSASASGAGAAPAGTAGAARITPGLYETKVEVKIGGLPAAMAKAMEAQVETKQDCVTPEEAAKSGGDLFADKDDNCESKDVVFSNGKIQGTLVCKGKGAGGNGAATVSLDGSYTPTSFDVTGRMQVAQAGKEMTVDSRIVARRIGECKAGDE